MRDTLFSIIVPSHNSERTLARTVESIFNSDYKDFEVIIVDDAGRRHVKEYIKEGPKITILRNGTAQGPAYSRNLGAAKSRGDTVVFIDSDIYIKRDTLSRINMDLEEKGLDGVTGIYDPQIPHKDFFSDYFNLRLRKGYLDMPEITEACNAAIFAVKKDIFTRIGRFDPKYKEASIEDIEFGRRFVSGGYKLGLDKDLSVTHDKKVTLKSILINDFRRPSDRVVFASDLKDIRGIFKNKRFSYVGLNQLIAALLTPFIWTSLILGFFNVRFFILATGLMCLHTYLNRNWLLYFYKKRGTAFFLKGLFFIFITLSAALLGVIKGSALNIGSKVKSG